MQFTIKKELHNIIFIKNTTKLSLYILLKVGNF
ncbi:hypothetical protein SAMN05444275_11546 [Myroides odoratimimus subsp. xuanwuensis]|nr:hypothetical protein SAMN05444275_11546 [Myroides odoratimimus subsp. xuanwuensis]